MVLYVSFYFVATLWNDESMLAFSLVTAFFCLLPYSLMYGANNANLIFVAKAWETKDVKTCGQYLQKSLIIGTLIFPLVILFAFLYEPILIACGYPTEVTSITRLFVLICLPSILINFYIDTIYKFLWITGHGVAVVWILVIIFILHIPICYIFVYTYDQGFQGIAKAHNVSAALCFLMFLSYLIFWSGFSKELYIPTKEIFDNPMEFGLEYFKQTSITLLEYLNLLAPFLLAVVLGN